ncbi:H-2 class II histocompatibility antigen, I-A beta chain-like [Ictidomys tridecemlineatus]|uniref:H-2 class II histocompatibility antigen, I-A beta chain-like n=1 Tax=Ictidomys tridecemlineatus TaxID=43179 RepID=UPI00067FFCE7|nr:H-2 class II histocompatibility antigen, I-A beta chain-like [Ictidomys tridecemlineatus]KAG3289180.1 H-2 class II histocompatibility antigen, I-A beta chain-like [Ictidomys tridecemlineatus]
MARQIYNKEEILCFDSDVGVFVAVTELRMSSAKSWNAQKDLLAEYRAHVDTLYVTVYLYHTWATSLRLQGPVVALVLKVGELRAAFHIVHTGFSTGPRNLPVGRWHFQWVTCGLLICRLSVSRNTECQAANQSTLVTRKSITFQGNEGLCLVLQGGVAMSWQSGVTEGPGLRCSAVQGVV